MSAFFKMNAVESKEIPVIVVKQFYVGCFLPPPIPPISLLLRSDYSFTASVNLLTFYPQA